MGKMRLISALLMVQIILAMVNMPARAEDKSDTPIVNLKSDKFEIVKNDK